MGEAIAAVVKLQDPTLREYLRAFWDGQQLQLFIAVMGAGSAGMVANWIRKWTNGEIAGSLLKYLFVDNQRSTLLAIFTYTGAALTALQADVFHVGPEATFVGWGAVIWMAAVNGYFIDNFINKGQRAVWTPEQRAEARKPGN